MLSQVDIVSSLLLMLFSSCFIFVPFVLTSSRGTDTPWEMPGGGGKIFDKQMALLTLCRITEWHDLLEL